MIIKINPSNFHTLLIGLAFKIFSLNIWGVGLVLTPSYLVQSNQRVDCPELGLDIGDACDDGKEDTQNDTVQPNCTCLGIASIDDDSDGDGFTKELDCDDTDPNINPNMQEIPDNGIDEDCSGEDLTQVMDPDFDMDGTTLGNGDCDDNNPNIYPGAQEILDNGIDEDCNGIIDDITSSIHENSLKNSFDLFPNPAYDYLQINFKIPLKKVFHIQVTDMLGKVVYQQYIDQLKTSSVRINTQSYSNGFYVVSITQAGQQISKKFICLN